MVTLNNYLYSGDTVFRIIQKYSCDLRQEGQGKGNGIDLAHAEFLDRMMDMLEHNDFLTAQSQKIRDFYIYMAKEYPFLAFTFKGRIKSLIRSESKFNGYIVGYIYKYYQRYGCFPTEEDLKKRLEVFRDLIAYRIVISVPRCRAERKEDREQQELEYLYRIAAELPDFLTARGFELEPAGNTLSTSDLMREDVRPYYRDYISNESEFGYQSLHVTFFDHSAGCRVEVQLRTKEMDDIAEIGPANHLGYEKRQEKERARRDAIPEGECVWFDEAYERLMLLQNLELKDLDVNMFAAVNNSLINDGCGLYRGRMILPYEHLSRFQNDI